MEHRDDAPLADEPQAGAIPNDQPLGGTAGPEVADPSDVEVHKDEDEDG